MGGKEIKRTKIRQYNAIQILLLISAHTMRKGLFISTDGEGRRCHDGEGVEEGYQIKRTFGDKCGRHNMHTLSHPCLFLAVHESVTIGSWSFSVRSMEWRDFKEMQMHSNDAVDDVWVDG